MILFLGECYNIMFALWHMLAVCRVMSSVTFVRLIDRLNFSAIFLHYVIASGLEVCVKILGEYSELNGRGHKKLAFFNQYVALVQKPRKTWP